jgi:hypothetical protein
VLYEKLILILSPDDLELVSWRHMSKVVYGLGSVAREMRLDVVELYFTYFQVFVSVREIDLIEVGIECIPNFNRMYL